jgi:hypothetical protein
MMSRSHNPFERVVDGVFQVQRRQMGFDLVIIPLMFPSFVRFVVFHLVLLSEADLVI